MDGYVHVAHNTKSDWREMGSAYYGKGLLNGQHNLTLLVKDNTFTVLVDDRLVKKFKGFIDKLTDGDLNYPILSGTNKGFGTRCKLDNTKFWYYPR